MRIKFIRKGAMLVEGVELNNHEATLFLTLCGHRNSTLRFLIETIWPNPNFQPDTANKAVQVYICRIRRKLWHTGIRIGSRWGQGYTVLLPDAP